MDDSDECTAVLSMQKEFNKGILSQHAAGTGMTQRLSFTNLSGVSSGGQSKNYQGVTMSQALEKMQDEKKKQTDLLAAKAKITDLETKLVSTQTSYKRARIEYERDVMNINEERKLENNKLESLKQQLNLLMRKEEESRQEATEYRQKLDCVKSSLDQKILSLQKEKFKLESDLQDSEQACRSKLTELKSEKLRLEAELQINETELNDLREQLQNALRRCSESNQMREELEETRLKEMHSQQCIKDLEVKVSRLESDMTLGSTMQSQLAQLPELEKECRKLKEENKYLKDTQENTFLLREQVEGLQRKVDKSEAWHNEIQTLKVQNGELKKKLSKWEAPSLGKAETPEELALRVTELQKANVLLLEKQGVLHSSAQQLLSVQQEVEALKEKNIKGEEKLQQIARLLKRQQQKLTLITQERDSYKNILDTYESDLTVNMASQANARVKQLEDIHKSYQVHMNSLEVELQKSNDSMLEVSSRKKLLEGQVAEGIPQPVTSDVDQKLILQLREKVEELEKKIETITKKKKVPTATLR